MTYAMKRLVLGLCLLVNACSVAPTYQRPALIMPETYQAAGKWLPVATTSFTPYQGAWWAIYADSTLNRLEDKLTVANQDLQSAFYCYQAARAAAASARAAYFPLVQGSAKPLRTDVSSAIANVPKIPLYNDAQLGMSLTYEVDAWGRVRAVTTAAEQRALASEYDLAAIQLSLHAELAADYFALRTTDHAQRLLDETVRMYQRALYLTTQLHQGGAVAQTDVDQAQTQLQNTLSQATEMRLRRVKLEHALALLLGEAPAAFHLPKISYQATKVTVVPDLPSTLLQKRPDIAAAQARVCAANADIGAARTAFLPAFIFRASGGFESQTLANLLSLPSLFWSLGPEVTQLLFDGGKARALVATATATYQGNVASYRQTVLTAFKDVEDSLATLHYLDLELLSQQRAVRAANRALTQANYRYRGGATTYLEVVVSQNTALQAQLTELNLAAARQQASVQLIKALGGGWQVPST